MQTTNVLWNLAPKALRVDPFQKGLVCRISNMMSQNCLFVFSLYVMGEYYIFVYPIPLNTSGPEVIKRFHAQLSWAWLFYAYKFQITNNCKFCLAKYKCIAEHENFSANGYKMPDRYEMPVTGGVFIFIRRENFMLSWVEHEKRFIISRSDLVKLLK